MNGAIERYLADLDRRLAVPARYRRRVLAEAGDHLADSAAALESGGRSGDEADAEAVRRFDPGRRLAGDINAGWASAQARRAPAWAFVAGVGVLAAAVAAIPAVPSDAAAGGAPVVAAAALMASVGLQLAVVAGAVALLRVAGRRSAPVLGSADRSLVWRAARIGVGATAVAALGLLGVAAEQAHRSGSGPGRVVAAGLGMLAVLAAAGGRLRRPLPTGDAGGLDVGDPDVEVGEPGGIEDSGPAVRLSRRSPGAGERLARAGESLVTIVRSWPGAATALVAGLSAWGAYAHAEASRPGSLLTAAVETAAVVVFARVFGPALELLPGAAPPDGSS